MDSEAIFAQAKARFRKHAPTPEAGEEDAFADGWAQAHGFDLDVLLEDSTAQAANLMEKAAIFGGFEGLLGRALLGALYCQGFGYGTEFGVLLTEKKHRDETTRLAGRIDQLEAEVESLREKLMDKAQGGESA